MTQGSVLHFQEFPKDLYGNNGNLDLTAIDRLLFQAVQKRAAHSIGRCTKEDNCGFFLSRITLLFNRNLYREAYSEEKVPITLFVNAVGFGKSSFDYESKCVSDKTGEILATRIGSLVYVNLNTRKPDTIPDWFRYDLSDSKTGKVAHRQPIEIPETAKKLHAGEFEVVPAFVDENKHANSRAFLYFGLRTIGKDTSPLSRIVIDFKSESFLGDRIYCQSWKDIDEKAKYYFMCYLGDKELSRCVIYAFEDISPKL